MKKINWLHVLGWIYVIGTFLFVAWQEAPMVGK